MLYEILKNATERFPDNIAVLDGSKQFTYRELLQLTDRLAVSLERVGLQQGDRLSFFLYNCPELIACYFACFKIGVTVIPINHRLKQDEVRYIISRSQPAVLISKKNLFAEIASGLPELSSVRHCFLLDVEEESPEASRFSALLGGAEDTNLAPRIPGTATAVVLYTSGTTGKPKGVVLAHDQMMMHTTNHRELVGYGSEDRTLVCLALSNNFAFSHQMLSALHAGAALVINAFFDPDEVLKSIETDGITMLYMMPVMFHSLNQRAAARGIQIANRLRLAIVAGDTTPRVVFEQFQRNFGLEMCEGIGMTETQIYALNPLCGGKKLGSVGLPVGYTEVEVQDDQGKPLPSGVIGEIAVRGPIVMRSYLHNPEATMKSFRHGWFLTGDLGCFDDDGYLWFKGRRKQLIVRGGSNISPHEVEEVFYHHPAVFEVGVIGVPDEFAGESVHAFVALKPGVRAVSEQELLAFARSHLADYKVPASITFIDTLPKSATGKIDRKLLMQ